MSRKLLELAAEIARAQASHAPMAADDIERVLSRTYNSLRKLQEAEAEGRTVETAALPEEESREAALAQNVDPSKSIQRNKVVCLECGAEFKQLTANHLRSHGLTPREYKRKWGLPLKQPLAARALTTMRSKAAKKRGLPQKLQEYIEERRKNKASGSAESGSAGAGERPRTIRRRSSATT